MEGNESEFEIDGVVYVGIKRHGCIGCSFTGVTGSCKASGDSRVPSCTLNNNYVIFVEKQQ
jgi:hypothetical protein